MQQKWEYLTLDVVLSGDQWRPRYKNGESIPDWQTTCLAPILSEIGLHGWELVASSTTGTGTEILYFKRAIESSDRSHS
jgi:hypothetical protein